MQIHATYHTNLPTYLLLSRKVHAESQRAIRGAASNNPSQWPQNIPLSGCLGADLPKKLHRKMMGADNAQHVGKSTTAKTFLRWDCSWASSEKRAKSDLTLGEGL